MFYLYLFLIVIAVSIIIAQIGYANRKKIGNSLLAKVKNKEGFNAEYTLLNHDKNQLLALDKSGKILICEALYDGTINDKLINFSDILEAEIKTNNTTISKISVGGTIAGVVLAGGVGALIGSQNNKKSIEKIKSISLKINTKDFDNPVITFQIFQSMDDKGVNPDSFSVQEPLNNAEKWEGMFKIILEQNKSTY